MDGICGCLSSCPTRDATRFANRYRMLILCFLMTARMPICGFCDEPTTRGINTDSVVRKSGASALCERRPTLQLPHCDYVTLHRICKLGTGPSRENSGIVKSRVHQNVYWLHNDSGDEPRVYAINAQGKSYGATDSETPGVLLEGAVNVDWEDITVDDQGNLIIADVGNNHNDRQDLTLYILHEPDPSAQTAEIESKIVVQYPDQREFPAAEDDFNFDCEAVFTVDNAIHLLTKHRSDDRTTLYRLESTTEKHTTLRFVDEYDTQGGVVAADCSRDGLRLVVVTYQSIWLFERADKTASFFDGDVSWGRLLSKQVEAVTFQDDQTLLLADEQLGELYHVDLQDLVQVQRAGEPMLEPDPTRSYPSAAQLATIKPGAWTMVVIPDTQYYVDHTRKIPPTPEVLESMMRWIVEHKQQRNIQLVVQVGDIVDNDTQEEWAMAKRAWQILDGEVPYVLATGNHDYEGNAKVRRTHFGDYFTPHDNPLNDPEHGGILRELFEPGSLENAVYEYLAPDGRKWLLVSLEWAPRDEVVKWANEVVGQRKYRKQTAVLVTHGYLYHDDTRYDWTLEGTNQEGNPFSYAMSQGGDSNDGEMLWQKLVRQNSSFQMVLCGHVTGSKEERMALGDRAEVGYRLSVGNKGNRVHQLLFNAQRRGDAGDGWLRLMEFDPDQRTVQVKTYSPWLDARGLAAWRTDEDDYFVIKLTHF
jgi:hypothetical protein